MITPHSVHQRLAQQNKALARRLHQEARLQVFDRIMGDVNDALTAILGTCDARASQIVPLIKDQIGTVNSRLRDARCYYAEYSQKGSFDVNTACRHMSRVIHDHFGERPLRVQEDLAAIQTLAVGDLVEFEQFILYLFLHLINGTHGPVSIKVITRQKDSHIMIILRKTQHQYSLEELEILQKRVGDSFPQKVTIEPYETGLEVVIRLPMKFAEPKIVLSRPVIKVGAA